MSAEVDRMILDARIKAWVYAGVELEVEYAGLVHEQEELSKILKDDEDGNMNANYNAKRIKKNRAELLVVNSKITDLQEKGK